MISVLYKKK